MIHLHFINNNIYVACRCWFGSVVSQFLRIRITVMWIANGWMDMANEDGVEVDAFASDNVINNTNNKPPLEIRYYLNFIQNATRTHIHPIISQAMRWDWSCSATFGFNPFNAAARKKKKWILASFIYLLFNLHRNVRTRSPPDRHSQFQFLWHFANRSKEKRGARGRARHLISAIYAFDRSRRSIVVISANRSVRKTWSTLFNSRQRRNQPGPSQDGARPYATNVRHVNHKHTHTTNRHFVVFIACWLRSALEQRWFSTSLRRSSRLSGISSSARCHQ